MSARTNTISSENRVLCQLIGHKLTYCPFDCKWVPNSSKLVTVGHTGTGSNVKGDLRIFKLEDIDLSAIENTKLKLTSECQSNNKLRCCTFQRNNNNNNNERLISVGDFTGNLIVWDVDRLEIPISNISSAHSGTINAIDSYLDSVATAGADGKAKLWDLRSMNQPKFTFEPKLTAETSMNAWSVYTDDQYIMVGYQNGDLNCYDLRAGNKLLDTYHSSASVSSIAANSNRDYSNILLGGSEQNPLSSVKINSATNKIEQTANNSNNNNNNNNNDKSKYLTWCTRYSPFSKNTFAMTTSKGSVLLYSDKDTLIDEIKLTDYPVLSIDFNQSQEGLMSTVSLNRVLSILITPFK